MKRRGSATIFRDGSYERLGRGSGGDGTRLERQEAKTVVAQTPAPEGKPEIFSLKSLADVVVFKSVLRCHRRTCLFWVGKSAAVWEKCGRL